MTTTSTNPDEIRNDELRTRRDAFGVKQLTNTDGAALDTAHFLRIWNDEIVSKRGTK